MTQNTQKWLTVSQLALKEPAFSENSIRWLIRGKETNGFSKCIRKVGGKLLINIDDFDKWIDGHKWEQISVPIPPIDTTDMIREI